MRIFHGLLSVSWHAHYHPAFESLRCDMNFHALNILGIANVLHTYKLLIHWRRSGRNIRQCIQNKYLSLKIQIYIIQSSSELLKNISRYTEFFQFNPGCVDARKPAKQSFAYSFGSPFSNEIYMLSKKTPPDNVFGFCAFAVDWCVHICMIKRPSRKRRKTLRQKVSRLSKYLFLN